MTQIPVIIDCDPGNDDAVALLVALGATHALKVIGITTVAGNVNILKTTINALKICELANQPEIPVYSGCEKPLYKSTVNAAEAHGETGMDGCTLPPATGHAKRQHAVDFIIETLENCDDDKLITLLTMGPLTNIATALQKKPEIQEKIQQIVMMGGCIAAGNITAGAEFNFFVDPDAAQYVLKSGIRCVVLPLEITHLLTIDPERLRIMQAIPNEKCQQIVNMIEATESCDIEQLNLPGRALHDPCVPIYLLRPEAFETEKAYIDVNTQDGPYRGQSTISFFPAHLDNAQNVHVAVAMDDFAVFDTILSYLSDNITAFPALRIPSLRPA